MAEKKMTPKELAFCDLYIANRGNGAKAARDAGYPAKYARQTAYELLTKPYIKKEIDFLMDQQSNKLKISRQRTIRHLASVAFQPKKTMTKVQALKLLGDFYGLYNGQGGVDSRDEEASASRVLELLRKRKSG
jgi:phage terminase small subunit